MRWQSSPPACSGSSRPTIDRRRRAQTRPQRLSYRDTGVWQTIDSHVGRVGTKSRTSEEVVSESMSPEDESNRDGLAEFLFKQPESDEPVCPRPAARR